MSYLNDTYLADKTHTNILYMSDNTGTLWYIYSHDNFHTASNTQTYNFLQTEKNKLGTKSTDDLNHYKLCFTLQMYD